MFCLFRITGQHEGGLYYKRDNEETACFAACLLPDHGKWGRYGQQRAGKYDKFDAAEMTQFESLGASDCLMVLLAVLGNSDFLQVELYNMSPGAKALAEEITTRINNMTDAEKAEFNKQIRTIFNLQKVLVDGPEVDGISIELTITKDGKETKERYSFYNDQNIWKLYQIEQLQTVVA